MEATELRIGNYIEFNNHIEKIQEFDNHSITSHRDGQGRTYAYISADPIPLTGEWLLKFGFDPVKPRRGIALAFKKRGVRINVSNCMNPYYGRKAIDYVHQLQNLYFALTGKELEL